ncbi:polysaccharide biosynthesis C-terminal domain-containing protein [Candidatus Omnitrophota bacterium]
MSEKIGITRGTVLLLGTRAVIILISIATSAIIARYLGPSGKGVLALLVTINALAWQFGNIGLPSANVYFVAKNRELLSKIVANSLWFGVTGAGAAVFFISLLYIFFHKIILVDIRFPLLLISLLSLPAFFVSYLLSNILWGMQKVKVVNKLNLLNSALFLISAITVCLLLKQGITGIVIANLTVYYICALVYMLYLKMPEKIDCFFDKKLFLNMRGYAARSYISCLLGFLIIKSDIFLVNFFLGSSATGVYSIDVAFADMIYILPATIGALLFPKIAAGSNTMELTQRISRHLIFIMLIICIFAGILSKFAIRFIYGEMYLGAITPFYWLLPGIFCLGIGTLFMNDLAGRGQPPIVYIAPGISLLLNILLNLIFIPRYGVTGAAITSSLAYGLMAILTIWYFIRLTGTSLRDAVLIKGNEIIGLFNKLRISHKG